MPEEVPRPKPALVKPHTPIEPYKLSQHKPEKTPATKIPTASPLKRQSTDKGPSTQRASLNEKSFVSNKSSAIPETRLSGKLIVQYDANNPAIGQASWIEEGSSVAIDEETKSKAEVLQIVSQYAKYTGPFPPKQKTGGVKWPLPNDSVRAESPPRTVERVENPWQNPPVPKHRSLNPPNPEVKNTPTTNKSRSSNTQPSVNQQQFDTFNKKAPVI